MPEIAAESRREIAAGASEIAIDDFVDSALSERPKTGAPAPAQARPIRETVRGMGSPGVPSFPSAPGAPRPVTPRSPAVFESPTTDRDPPRFSPSTTNFIAVKDQRISELEEQLAKAKAELAARTRPQQHAPAVRTVPMQAVARPPTAPSPKGGGTLFMPVTTAPSTPSPAPQAPAPPPPAPAPPPPAPPAPPPGVGATLFMPANQAPMPKPSAHPSAQYPAVLDPSLNAAYAQPRPHPSAQYPAVLDPRLQTPPSAAHAASHPASAPPTPEIDDDETGGRTMMLDPSMQPPLMQVEPVAPVGAAPAPMRGDYVSQHPAPVAPSHLSESTEKAFERTDLPQPPPRKRGMVGVLAVAATLAIGLAGGAYAYRMGLGPFATAKTAEPEKIAPATKATSTAAATATAKATTTAAATGGATGPAASATASASAQASASPTAEPSATAAPPASSTAAPTADGPEDLSALLSFQAYLTVASAADAEVVVQGQSAGRTNARLMVRCGPRNVRLRGEGSKWLTDGQHVQITCMQHTKVAIDPPR